MTFAILKVGERLGLGKIGLGISLFLPVKKMTKCFESTSSRGPQEKEDVHNNDS